MQDLPDGVTIEGDEEQESPVVSIPKPFPVQLPDNCTWSNNPNHLAIATYFDPTKPNLGADFGLIGLQPVIRDTKSDKFLLKDAQDTFYQWSIQDGNMWQLEDMQDAAQAVAAIMQDSGILKRTQVWNISTA
ncbi:hypothetical protein ACHAPO_010243 [Fusarium lateritium]